MGGWDASELIKANGRSRLALSSSRSPHPNRTPTAIPAITPRSFFIKMLQQILPTIRTSQDLLNNHYTMDFIYAEIVASETMCLKWLVNYELVKNERTCDNCDIGMKFLSTRGRWRCGRCAREVSVRCGSFASGSRLSLCLLMKILFWWTLKLPQNVVAEQVSVNVETVGKWFRFCRQICVKFMSDHPPLLGGVGKIVEVDESVFGKRKYNRGRMTKTQWVLGGRERGTGNSFLCVVPDRSAQTLLPTIFTHVSAEPSLAPPKTPIWGGGPLSQGPPQI
jgi:hypothetical protein